MELITTHNYYIDAGSTTFKAALIGEDGALLWSTYASNKGDVLGCARAALSNQRGDFYISDAVKIIIAVVLGALLLAALTLIFNDTVIPRITSEIEGLFG